MILASLSLVLLLQAAPSAPEAARFLPLESGKTWAVTSESGSPGVLRVGREIARGRF